MKLNEKDKQLFQSLHTAEMGKQLVDFLTRFQGHICDSRNWRKEDTKESAAHAAQALQWIVDTISLQSQKKSVNPNDYE